MSEPLVSIVVPTFNRAGLLERTVHSLLRQTADQGTYEIIVVDNNSTDQTGTLVKRLMSHHPMIRHVLEPRPGVSFARNAGLDASRGGIVAYIDDDAFAVPHWVDSILRSFREVEPAPHVVGGPAVPLFLEQKPLWYRDAYDTFSWGGVSRFLTSSECFYGLNVAFKRETLLGVGGFSTEIGPKGTSLAFGEENELFERLWEHADGSLVAYYSPDAIVLHCVPSSRTRLGYRVRKGFAAGQSHFWRQRQGSPSSRAGDWLKAGYMFVRAVAWAIRRFRRFPNRQTWVVECVAQVARRLGYLVAASGLHIDMRRSH